MSSVCPGFVPHAVKPTRCRRCFRDYSDHQKDAELASGKYAPLTRRASSGSSVSANVTLSLPRRRRESTNPLLPESPTPNSPSHVVNDTSKESSTTSTTKTNVTPSKPPSGQKSTTDSTTESKSASFGQATLSTPTFGRRVRQRSLSQEGETPENKTTTPKEEEKPRAPVLERRRRWGSSGYQSMPEDNIDINSAYKKRIQILAAKEVEKTTTKVNDGGTGTDVEFILKVKPTVPTKKQPSTSTSTSSSEESSSSEEEQPVIPPKKGATTSTTNQEVTNIQSKLTEMKKKVELLEGKVSRVERERDDLLKRKKLMDADKEALQKTAAELQKMRTKIADMQVANEDLKTENKSLKTDVKNLKTEVARKIAPETSKQQVDTLRIKLHQSEKVCQELMEENEEIKKEVRALEEELEELHDNFREDQASEFRDLKKELETTSKNCRVLQFKFRKAEKRCEQLELERHALEERLKDMHATSQIDVDKAKMKGLEHELALARDMSAKMHSEIEALRDGLKKAESENEILRKQLSGEKVGNVSPNTQKLSSPMKEALMGKDYESVVRELYDTMERENDLREQLKFSEDEAKTMRRKMSSLEQENETLVMQMKKLVSVVRARSEKKDDDSSSEDEMSSEDMKLHLDFVEQEMGVLRRKLDDTDQENANLQQEVKYLQEKLINQPITSLDLPEPPPAEDGSGPNVYYQHKVRLLEFEAREMRKKLIDKERENERLHSEVEVHRRKASKVIVRSRSLDGDLQVDLKRQLQLVEQEAGILRQKVVDLETENEKINADNKRLNLRLSRKPPPGPEDLLHVENLELKMKLGELENKITAMREEAKKGAAMYAPPTVIQEYKPRREVPTETESDLIASLKKKMKSKEEEFSALQGKVMQLEIDNNRLNRDYKRLKDNLNYKKKPPRLVRETATRMELREIVTELQDEISELQVTLRGRESVQETMEEDLEKTRRDLDTIRKDVGAKEERLDEERSQICIERETLKQEAVAERERAATLEQQLKELADKKGTNVDLVGKMSVLQAEKEEMEKRARAAEDALEKKTARLRDVQEKMNATSTLKEDLAKSNRMLEEQRTKLQKEVDRHKDLLSKAEDQVEELKMKMDHSEKDLTSMRKEFNQLQNELEDERTRLKHVDNRQTEVAVGWLKERDDMRRQLTELRSRSENLKQQLNQQDKAFHDKELRLKDEYKKKREAAVREAKEKAEGEMHTLKEEEKSIKAKLNDSTEKLEKAEASLREAAEKQRQSTTQYRKEKEEWGMQQLELESQLRTDGKKRERMEREHDAMLKSKEEELLAARDRVVQLEREQRKGQNRVMELETRLMASGQVEKELERARRDYDDLTTKYEQLEAEFVKMKGRLVQEKEQVESNLATMKRDHQHTYSELKSLKETFNSRQDSWIKEKLDLQEEVKEKDAKLHRMATWEQEKMQLKDTIDEKDSLIESYRKEEKHLKEERERLRKRTEDQGKRVIELERMERVSRSLSGRSEGGRDAHDMRNRMDNSERSHQAELAAVQSEYDGKMSLMASEMSNMQKQIATLAQERDRYKSQAAEANKVTNEMRTGTLKRERARQKEEVEYARGKVKELQNTIDDIQEQLDDSMLENKNLKLQYETDRNSWEIQASELKSKINQLEEQKMLDTSRGPTRALAKTRLELAWEKERNDMQRLLGETQQTLTDYKDRLQRLEKEAETEKQSLRKEMTELQRSSDKEQQDHRRKMSELHSDMIEVRETNAKLRGQFERLRKEREILLREREEWRQRMQTAQDMHAKLNALMEDVKKMADLLSPKGPLVNGELPEAQQKDKRNQLDEVMGKIKEQTEDLRKVSATLKEDERMRRTMSFRRAVSAQEVNQPQLSDPGQRWMNPQRVTNYPVPPPSMIIRPPPRQKTLQRKSLSLDHTLTAADMMKIWDSGDESATTTPSGSLLSLRMSHRYAYAGYESDSSLPESEASRYGLMAPPRRMRVMTSDSEAEDSVSGSTENVSQPKASLKDKLKVLRRTRSIEVSSTGQSVAQAGMTSVTVGLGGAGAPLRAADKEEKEKSLRSKISKVLRKPLSRSTSMDSGHAAKSTAPALPPKNAVPESPPQRPKAEKPGVASKGPDRGSRRSLLGRLTPERWSKSRSSDGESTSPTQKKKGTLSKQSSLTETRV